MRTWRGRSVFAPMCSGLLAVAVLGVAGCGAAHGHPKTAAGFAGPAPLDLLPPGALVYGRIDMRALRASPYADRVAGWYRQFAPAVPDFNAKGPGAALFEQIVKRLDAVAIAFYAPASIYQAMGAGGVGDAPLGKDAGAVAVVRGDFDLAFVQHWADRFHQELVKTGSGKHVVLTTPDPSGDQFMVTELAPHLLAIVAGGRLDDAQLRLSAVARRLDAGATELAAKSLVPIAHAIHLDGAPIGVVGTVPPSLGEELGGELGSEGVANPSPVEGIRHAGLRLDPSDGLLFETVAQLDDAQKAQQLATWVSSMDRKYRDNAVVLLLGLDMWLEHTQVRAEGDIARATMRLPDAELKTWLFHVEHLAAAVKAFFAHGGGLGSLFSGFGAAAPPASGR